SGSSAENHSVIARSTNDDPARGALGSTLRASSPFGSKGLPAMHRRARSRKPWLVVAWSALALAGGWIPLRGEDRRPTPAEVRLRSDVSYLADDAREGRAPGSPGSEAAADYIAGRFKDAGLKPAPGGDGYFQRFTLTGTPTLSKPPGLSLSGPGEKSLEAGKDDFTPLAIGSGGTLAGVPVVFAGYGITAKDPARALDYDDYAGL